MQAAHGIRAFDIGQRSGDFQDAVIAPGGQLHAVGGLDQKRLSAGVRRSDPVEQGALGAGVQGHGPLSGGFGQGGIALGLDGAGPGDAGADRSVQIIHLGTGVTNLRRVVERQELRWDIEMALLRGVLSGVLQGP